MTITPAAQDQLDAVLSDSEFLEIALSGGGCGGLNIELNLMRGTNSSALSINDQVAWGCNLSKALLTGGSLDYARDNLIAKFEVKLPLGIESCGCGASIALPKEK
jgi:Fe-S cluster assembly iron-binding protein IscA